MNNQLNLSKDSILKLFIRYAIPAIIGMLISSLYIVVDGIFVGKGVGANGLAAVNIAMPFINFALAISMMIAIGGGTLTSIELGKGNKERASEIFSLTFATLMMVSLTISLGAIFFSKDLALTLGATEAILSDVASYLKTLGIFNAFFMSAYLMDMGIRSMGKPNYSMVCMISSSVLNIALDYVFIIKLSMGIFGAALATGISQMIAFIALISYYFRNESTLKIKAPKFELNTIKKIFLNGSSEFVTEIAVGITTLLFNIVIMERMGEIGVSAYSIIGYISTIIFAILIGISQAMQPIVSHNYGAKQYDRVMEVLKLAMKVVFAIGAISTVMLLNFSEPLIAMFTKGNEELLSLTSNAAGIYSMAFLINGLNIIASAYFTGIEDAKTSALISTLRGLVFISLGLFLLPNRFGMDGIWLSVPFAETATLIFTAIYLYKNIRKFSLANK